MMRLGLLGSDARIAEVAAAAVRRGDRLVAGFDVPEGSLGGLQVPPLGSWDRLIDAAVCDVVLVGATGWDDSRAQAVRTLVQAGRPLVLAQPLELSMLWAYELDMIRRDTGSLLVPCLPDRLHPFIMRLQEVIAATLAGVGDLGTVESLHFELRGGHRFGERGLVALPGFERRGDLLVEERDADFEPRGPLRGERVRGELLQGIIEFEDLTKFA